MVPFSVSGIYIDIISLSLYNSLNRDCGDNTKYIKRKVGF